MWFAISRFILRNRIGLLIFVGLITVFMGWNARTVKLSYRFGGILPTTDSAYIAYQNFVETFGEDGNVIVLGIEGEEIYNLKTFNAWYQLGQDLKNIRVEMKVKGGSKTVHAVDSIFSVANLYNLKKDEEKKRFIPERIVRQKPTTQEELDSIVRTVRSLPFYDKLLFNDNTNASMMVLFVNTQLFNSEDRGKALEEIKEKVAAFSGNHIKVHYSGLPFIRTLVSERVKTELLLFSGLALVVSAFFLYFFFRSFRVMFFSMLIVAVCVVWGMGFVGLFDYRITIVMGLIPPLIIVLGIPNCVFLINEYHQEFLFHGNKIKALARVISKIGLANFLTNFNTAVGFATFIFVSSPMLREFGVISSIASMLVYIISLLLIPIIFSYLPPPQAKHVHHLEKFWVYKLSNRLVHVVTHRRKTIYAASIVLCLLAIYGMTKITATGYIVDDLPENDPVLTDLHFFEKNFNGVMPFEILIVDTTRKKSMTRDVNLRKIEKAQEVLAEYPFLSKSLSISEAVKFTRQAFYNGDPGSYQLITEEEKSFIGPYISGTSSKEAPKGENILKSFVDTTRQKTRITSQIKDLGTIRLNEFVDELKPRLDSIFDPQRYQVTLTGTSIVFLEGTKYLINDLIESLVLAILGIALLMALLFNSFRMILVSFIPNIIPLLITAGFMGYFNITIKPSTILVFSIAFGIAIDNTIHYLAKYRYELKLNNWNISISVKEALKESWVSILYTSVILFFGFSVFAASDFGGTVALGVLTAATILVAMFTNLLLLPAILLSLDRSATTHALEEPLLVIYDEEEDIDYSILEIKKSQTKPEE